MVDPQFITKFNRNDSELEEFALFSILVAGKQAKMIAKSTNNLSNYIYMHTKMYDKPLTALYYFVKSNSIHALVAMLKWVGVGCSTIKAQAGYSLAEKLIITRPDYLRVCTVDELESIKGIGSKTARFFIMHSRPNQRLASLDTHILHWLRDQGVNAPRSTPPKKSKRYQKLELTFLQLADKLVKDAATLDLEIWNEYSGTTKS